MSRAAPALAFALAVTLALGAGCEQTHVARGALERRADMNGKPGARVLENCEAR